MAPALLLAAFLAAQSGAVPTATPAVPAPAITPPAPVPTDWPFRFAPDDYPAAALRNHEQGTTRYRVEIGAEGRVTNCAITGSSGSALLDQTTCRIVSRWARFAPARDSAGNLVTDSREAEVSWRIGGDD
jgi:protein TonB